MTQSDKDFITRIQVSQLVTSDPYTEDFYAQVYGSLLRSRMGVGANEERVLKFGSGEGVGLGLTQRGGGMDPTGGEGRTGRNGHRPLGGVRGHRGREAPRDDSTAR